MLLLTTLISLALAQDAPPPDPPVEEPAPPPQVRILSTGAHGGIGSGQVQFSLYRRVMDGIGEEGGLAEVVSLRPVHGWLVRGSWAISARDRTLAGTLHAFRGEVSCDDPTPATRVRGARETLFIPGEQADMARALGLRSSAVSLRDCTADGVALQLIGPQHASLPTFELDQWETRLGLAWTLADGTALDSIGRPVDEGTRRFGVLRSARDEVDLFVSPGRFLDGVSSVRDGDLSLHRPTGLALLTDLAPAALVPGDTELAGGPEALLTEAPDLPWLASNWESDTPELRLPTFAVVESSGGVRVGLVGIVDPAIASRDPRFSKQGVRLTAAVPAARAAIAALRESEEPDVIVLLTAAPGDVLDRVRQGVEGVDVFLGDRDGDTRGLASLDVRLRTTTDEPQAGLSLPLGGAQITTAELSAGRLDHARVRPLPVPLTTPPDPETLARVTRVRAEVYPPLEDPLLPAPSPTSALTRDQLDKAVCEAILDETEADLALLPALPEAAPIPGTLTALLVADRVALPDQLEVHRVPGDRYAKLLDQAFGTVPITCGSPLGERFPKARGRPIDDDRVYTVVTTDRLRSSGTLDGLLSGARSPLLLDLPGTRTWDDAEGNPTSLRSTAVAALRRLRAKHGEALLDVLLARTAADKPPEWVLRVRQLSARVEAFQGVDDEAYAQVPETRATSPSSFTLGTAVDIAVEYGSARALWDLRGRTQFTRLRTAQGVQETADDAKLSSSVTLPGATVKTGPLSFRPFAEGLLDSELTPTETDAGVQNPRQADLSLTIGLSAPITGPLRALRIGALVLQDLAQTDKRAELGGRLEAQTRVLFGPRLVWTNQLDAFVYGNTPDQDASDLRFKVFLQSRLGLPLARWLDLAIFGDVFAFSGRVESTQAVGASATLGVGLDMGGVFGL